MYGLEKTAITSGFPRRIGEPIDFVNDGVLSGTDYMRLKSLGKVQIGTGHDNALKGIIVQFDICFPQYLTPQLQRYHWFEIVSSQSKMHMLTANATKDTFNNDFNKYVDPSLITIIKTYAENYRNATTGEDSYYWFMKTLSNLPMGYEMWMGITTNYLQLKTMYYQRRGHKLSEDYTALINMMKELPLFMKLIGESNE